jgi:hypothetical protein
VSRPRVGRFEPNSVDADDCDPVVVVLYSTCVPLVPGNASATGRSRPFTRQTQWFSARVA